MTIRIGPIDMMQLTFEIINKLLDKKLITEKDAKNIIKGSLDPNMPEDKKNEYVDSLFMKKDGK